MKFSSIVGSLLALVASTAMSQGLSADYASKIVGTYSGNCNNPKGFRVSISPTTVTLKNGRRTAVAKGVLEALSYFGNAPPENYLTTVLAQVRPDATLAVVLYEPEQGRLLAQLELDAPLLKLLEVRASDGKLPKC